MSQYSIDRTCDKHGCAKLALDPKLHLFDECFGGKIRMGDVDGAVERHGHILWLEWKVGCDLEAFDKIHAAQIIQAKAFTKNSDKQSFWVVVGNPCADNGGMDVRLIRFMKDGDWAGDWRPCTFEKLKTYLRKWYSLANGDIRVVA